MLQRLILCLALLSSSAVYAQTPVIPSPNGSSITSVTVTSLAAGATPTASLNGGVLALGIPAASGSAPTFTIGTTTALAAGATPTVSISGTSPNYTLNFGIPAGATGATGAPGAGITSVSVNTLAAGQSATASLSAGVLTLGIPAGANGTNGTNGTNGASIAPPIAYTAGGNYTQYELVTYGSGSAATVYQAQQACSSCAVTPGTNTAYWQAFADASGAAPAAQAAVNSRLGTAATQNIGAGQTFRILSAAQRKLGPKQPINQGSNAAPTVTLSNASGITTPTVFPFYSSSLGIDYEHYNYPGCQPLQLNISGIGTPIVNTAWVDPVSGGTYCTVETEPTASQVEVRFYNTGYPVRIWVDNQDVADAFQASNGGTSPGGGTSSTFVLASGASTNTGQYNGEIISILSGTGSGQTAKVLGYLGQLTCSAAANASGGNTTYSCTVTGGTLATYTGITFPATIAGFDNSANNGTFTCSVVTLASISCNNASGVADTHAATATALAAVVPTWTTTPDATSVYAIMPYATGGRTYYGGAGLTNGQINAASSPGIMYFTLTFPTTDRHNIKIESEDPLLSVAISQNGFMTAPPSETVTQMFAVTDSQDANFGSAATGVADFVSSGFISNVCRDLGIQCWHLAGASSGFNQIPTNNGQNYIQRVLPSPNAWVIDTSQAQAAGSAVITQNGISTASVSIYGNQAANIASALLTAFGSATFTVSPYPSIGYIISGTGSNASFTGPMTISVTGNSGTVSIRPWYGSLAPNIPVETYCPIIGSQAGNVVTVSAVNATCTLAVGQWVNIPALANIASGQVTSAANAGNAFGMVPAQITSLGTGTGGTGTYNVSVSQTVASSTMNAGPGLPFILYWQCSGNDGNPTAEMGLQTIVQNAIGSIASLYPQAVQVMQGTEETTGPAVTTLWPSEAIFYAAAQASLPYVNGQWPYMQLLNFHNGVSYFGVSGSSNIGKPVGTAGTNTDLLIGQDGSHRTYWGMMSLANEVEHYLAQFLFPQ
jgi:hypothetical protein